MSTQTPAIWILIPAFNEASILPTVLHDLKNHHYTNILVVDDGSTDHTAQVADQCGAESISLPVNRGQGAALQAGVEYLAKYRQPDIIVTFDADGQHQAKDIRHLLQPIINQQTDVVLGSRFLGSASDIPLLRRLLLRAGVIFTRLLSGILVTDTHNSLRAFSPHAYSTIKWRQRGPEHASEILDEIVRLKLRYQEVPVNIIYSSYAARKGQKNWAFITIGLRVLASKLIA